MKMLSGVGPIRIAPTARTLDQTFCFKNLNENNTRKQMFKAPIECI